MYSERHKRHYYYNTRTKESTWKKPKSKKKRKPKAANPNPESRASRSSRHLGVAKRKTRQLSEEPTPVWTTHYDPKHRRNYYYNRVTGKSTWTLPKRSASPSKPHSEVSLTVELNQEADVTTKSPHGLSDGKEEENDRDPAFASYKAFSSSDIRGVSPSAAVSHLGEDTPAPVELIPSWRRYFNAKTVDDPTLPMHPKQQLQEPQPEPQPMASPTLPHKAALQHPGPEGMKTPTLNHAGEPSRHGVSKVSQAQLQETSEPARPKALGLPFLSEIKAKKTQLQPAIKDSNTEGAGSRASAPPARLSFIDEIKTKLKERRESMEAEDTGLSKQTGAKEVDQTRSEPRDMSWPTPNSSMKKTTGVGMKSVLLKVKEEAHGGNSQKSILHALLSKSQEFHHHSEGSKEEGVSTETVEDEDWSSEEEVDAEVDSPSPSTSQAEAAWKPAFRVTANGGFQIQCEGDDWKDFDQDTRLEELDIEEKSVSEDSASALRVNRAALVTDLSNTFKHVKTLERYILRDQKVH